MTEIPKEFMQTLRLTPRRASADLLAAIGRLQGFKAAELCPRIHDLDVAQQELSKLIAHVIKEAEWE